MSLAICVKASKARTLESVPPLHLSHPFKNVSREGPILNCSQINYNKQTTSETTPGMKGIFECVV